MDGDGGPGRSEGSSEPVQRMEGGVQTARVEAKNKPSPKSVFVNSEPMREDQVHNAVKFLEHPKVRGSPVMYRRSFLEKKGLTKEEIDEAFRRVPDPSPNTVGISGASPSQGQATGVQPQISAQPLQPVAVPPNSGLVVSTIKKPWFRWYHAVLTLGCFCAAGAGTAIWVKNAIIPRFRSWILKIVAEENAKKASSGPTIEEEVAAAAKSAAVAASDVAKLSQDMLNFKIEERKYFDNFMKMLNVQVDEMKSIGNAIRRLETERGTSPLMMKPINGVQSTAGNVRSASAPLPVDSEEPPHPKSYMEIMEMIRRGETPPGIREINDQPPDPNQPLPKPQLPPRTKPWEAHQVESSYSQSESTVALDNGVNSLTNGKHSTALGNGSSEPWWQRKSVTISEVQPDGEDEHPQNVRRSWSPPQPPTVRNPEAAIAIRQPKKLPSSEQSTLPHGMVKAEEMKQPVDEQREETQTLGTEGLKLVEVGSENNDEASSSSSHIMEQQQIEV